MKNIGWELLDWMFRLCNKSLLNWKWIMRNYRMNLGVILKAFILIAINSCCMIIKETLYY